jgi:hypothetical protein
MDSLLSPRAQQGFSNTYGGVHDTATGFIIRRAGSTHSGFTTGDRSSRRRTVRDAGGLRTRSSRATSSPLSCSGLKLRAISWLLTSRSSGTVAVMRHGRWTFRSMRRSRWLLAHPSTAGHRGEMAMTFFWRTNPMPSCISRMRWTPTTHQPRCIESFTLSQALALGIAVHGVAEICHLPQLHSVRAADDITRVRPI